MAIAKQARRGDGRSRAVTGVRRNPAASGASTLPIYIRAVDVAMTRDDRDHLRSKLTARLARFGRRIERASVRVEDVNGPRGGVDKRCRIKVVLSGMPSVTVEDQQRALRAALDGALGRITAAVRRSVGRRDAAPVRRGARAPAPGVDRRRTHGRDAS